MFARNVCFSRSEWQDPRLMYPFPGAIGRFRIHGARILPPRPLFASRARKSCMARRCCQRCAAFRGTAARVAGPRTGRTGFAPCSPGLVRLPHARVSAISSAPPPLAPAVPTTHRCHSHVRAAPQRCRYSRGRIHRRRPSRRARRAHYAASPATSPVTSFIAVGGGEPLIGRPRRAVVIRARARRLRFPLPGPTTCASRCPLQPRATRVPRPSRTLRGLRHLRPPSASRTAANERNCAASSMRA